MPTPRDILNGPCLNEMVEVGAYPIVIAHPMRFIAPRLTVSEDCSLLVHFREPAHGTARKGAGV